METIKHQVPTIDIDGSQGEGGGQILRTALALSAITQQALTITGIRAKRERPGLLRQHLTGLRAMAELCSANCQGGELGSQQVQFFPGPIRAGKYRWAIGTAGSTSLVLQTVLFPLLMAPGASSLCIEGGTHNGQAPSYEFLQHSFAPVLSRLGYRVELGLDRYGFYPAGGGCLKASLEKLPGDVPSQPLVLDSVQVLGLRAFAWSANIPERIGRAEVALVGEALGIPGEHCCACMVPSAGPGNVVAVVAETDCGARVFTSFGEPRLALEKVSADCVAQVRRWLASGSAVDEHLQDQLLIPLALGMGGRFTTTAPTAHSLSNMAVIQRFLPVVFDCRELAKDRWLIEVRRMEPEPRQGLGGTAGVRA